MKKMMALVYKRDTTAEVVSNKDHVGQVEMII